MWIQDRTNNKARRGHSQRLIRAHRIKQEQKLNRGNRNRLSTFLSPPANFSMRTPSCMRVDRASDPRRPKNVSASLSEYQICSNKHRIEVLYDILLVGCKTCESGQQSLLVGRRILWSHESGPNVTQTYKSVSFVENPNC